MMPSPTIRAVLSLLLLVLCASTQAQTRAWLDRDRIAYGETATLNIETDQIAVRAPDYAPLLRDFELSGHTSRRQFETVNGVQRRQSLFAVALQPRRDGVIGIPALVVGTDATQPLTLTVTPAAAAPARSGGEVFIEAEADDQDPYVQQAVGYVVRLYYANEIPLVSGQLDLDTPEGASLQRVGEDLQYTRSIDGRRYTVVERRYLLIPERSGTLTIPGARFSGHGAGGLFDEFFGDGRRTLRAAGAPRILQVRPAPANAPQPWLPLHDLGLRYLATPQQARAGEAVTVTVELNADGAHAAQVPELQLAVGSDAQVFADPAQVEDSFDGGRPQVRIVRKFSIVPARAGTLRIPGPRMEWWDVRAGVARTASLPGLTVQVAPGEGGFGTTRAPRVAAGDAGDHVDPRDDSSWIRVPWVQGEVRPWAAAAVLFAALWLVTLMWGLHRRPARITAADDAAGAVPAAMPGKSLRDLQRALDVGDLGDLGDVLCAMASPPAADLDDLQSRLAGARQRDAVQALQRARWGDGDAGAARNLLRSAFKQGPQWHRPGRRPRELLSPLYPP